MSYKWWKEQIADRYLHHPLLALVGYIIPWWCAALYFDALWMAHLGSVGAAAHYYSREVKQAEHELRTYEIPRDKLTMLKSSEGMMPWKWTKDGNLDFWPVLGLAIFNSYVVENLFIKG